MPRSLSVVILGASGAVGGETLKELLILQQVGNITSIGRRVLPDFEGTQLVQNRIDIREPSSYSNILKGHDIAICTLGVGEPSRISKEEFVKIDKTAVIHFGKACKQAGVRHFELLSSVGVSASSSSFYLRTKGELVEELKALNFDRLSIFQPSMILTPTNRYGVLQGITLFIWPILSKLLFGRLQKYRGVKVATLGRAIALNVLVDGQGPEFLTWSEFNALTQAV